jgi:uncharacterized protein (TIGR00255 family)
MTGFGKATYENDKRTINIEIRTLNNKQTEISLKLPFILHDRENEIRRIAEQKLIRGKIDIFVVHDLKSEGEVPLINQSVVVSYFKQLNEISKKLDISNENILSVIMRFPEVFKNEKQLIQDDEWLNIRQVFEKAIDETIYFRKKEGLNLQKDLYERISKIKEYLNEIPKYEQRRIEKIKERLSGNLKEFITNGTYDDTRFHQELIYYIEKIDISEEITRLKSHIGYFESTIEENEPVGKKLGFISQEIGREINTIGSKASDSNIQKIIVNMKDELEKIKEQLMNIL